MTSFIFNTNVFNQEQTVSYTKAYIPLRCKTTGVGARRWVSPLTQKFALAIPTYWYLKMLNFVFPPTPNLKFALAANQWNIGCGGSPGIGACVGHLHFMLFTSCSLAFGTQREPSSQWNTGLSLLIPNTRPWVLWPILLVSWSSTWPTSSWVFYPLTDPRTSTFHIYRLRNEDKWHMLRNSVQCGIVCA